MTFLDFSNDSWYFFVCRPVELLFCDRVNLYNVVGQPVEIQESTNLATKWARLILVEGYLQATVIIWVKHLFDGCSRSDLLKTGSNKGKVILFL